MVLTLVALLGDIHLKLLCNVSLQTVSPSGDDSLN